MNPRVARSLTLMLLLFSTLRVAAGARIEHDWTFEALGGKFGVEQIYSGWIPSGRQTTVYFGRPIFTTTQSVWMLLAGASIPAVVLLVCIQFRRENKNGR